MFNKDDPTQQGQGLAAMNMPNTDNAAIPTATAPQQSLAPVTNNPGKTEISDDLKNMPAGAGEGWVKGYLAKKQLERQTNSDRRDEEGLNITKEAFGWKRQAQEQEQSLQLGMQAAARQGGYSGVIDYLQQQDPERAIQFTKAKLSLDKDIMSNQVLQATSKKDVASAMAESYGVLGKMGAAILKAPAEDRDAMYQQMLPIMKTVNPNAPDNLKDAVPSLMLSMSQSVPENQFWLDKSAVSQAQSGIGRLQNDIDRRVKNGETVENSPGLANLYNQMDGLNAKAKMHQYQVDNYHYNQSQQDMQNQKSAEGLNVQKAQLSNLYQKNYDRDTKETTDYWNNSAQLRNALTTLATDPTNPAALVTVQYGFAHAVNMAKVMSDLDIKTLSNNGGDMAVALKQMQSVGLGDKVPLNSREWNNIAQLQDQIDAVMTKNQMATNVHYANRLAKDGLDYNAISFKNGAPPSAIRDLMANPTKENLDYFEQTFHYRPDVTPMGTHANTTNTSPIVNNGDSQ